MGRRKHSVWVVGVVPFDMTVTEGLSKVVEGLGLLVEQAGGTRLDIFSLKVRVLPFRAEDDGVRVKASIKFWKSEK